MIGNPELSTWHYALHKRRGRVHIRVALDDTSLGVQLCGGRIEVRRHSRHTVLLEVDNPLGQRRLPGRGPGDVGRVGQGRAQEAE